MNIRTKILIGSFIPGVFVIVLLVLFLARSNDYIRQVALLNDEIVPSVNMLGQIEATGMGILEASLMPVELAEAQAAVDETEVDEYTDRRLHLLQLLNEYEALLPAEAAQHEALRTATDQLLLASEGMLYVLVNQESRAALADAQMAMEAAEDDFVSTVEAAIDVQNERAATMESDLEAASVQMNAVMIGLVVLSAASSLIFGLWFSRQVTASLRQLTQSAEAYASGQLNTRAEVQSRDEVGELAQVFNQMADDIQSMHSQLAQRVEERTAQLFETDSVRLNREQRLRETSSFTLCLLDDLQKAVKLGRPRDEMSAYLIKARSDFNLIR